MSNPALILVVFACVVMLWRRPSVADALTFAAIFAFVWAVTR